MITIVFMITNHPNSDWSAMTQLDWNGGSNWMKPAAYPFGIPFQRAYEAKHNRIIMHGMIA
ncbi:hypothetical protein [Nitrosospira sp. NpAV]|uniref:hypothetical protein n=1 Tax=Nitrosospira sp. NpAV TaxID=58133 RepID=UPI00059EF8DB|nr:hypothetical protein [Nitrosospira sp. NpAV]KIO49635.1 hypothetical protein SQ11_05840 [Nitrosospira sp. NpAV]